MISTIFFDETSVLGMPVSTKESNPDKLYLAFVVATTKHLHIVHAKHGREVCTIVLIALSNNFGN